MIIYPIALTLALRAGGCSHREVEGMSRFFHPAEHCVLARPGGTGEHNKQWFGSGKGLSLLQP